MEKCAIEFSRISASQIELCKICPYMIELVCVDGDTRDNTHNLKSAANKNMRNMWIR